MKYLKYIGIAVLVLGFMFSMAYYIKTNSRSAITYETEKLSYETIEEKIVATGSVIPEDEVEIKPQIPGIIDKILINEGDEVNVKVIGFDKRGKVRLSVGEGLGVEIISKNLNLFYERFPEIEIELLADTKSRSLSNHEADVLISLSRPNKGRLLSWKLCDYFVKLYGA